MIQTIIKGYKVQIFRTYNGQELFVTDAKGNQFYATRLHASDDALLRAIEVISQ